MKGINVLSLFDGMSCGQIALEKVGVKLDNYFAGEIKNNTITLIQFS
jgi:DNA (cytosine-5)-methyltransferase 3A